MKILTLENTTFDLNRLPDQIEEDIRFSVLDNLDPKNPDFFFVPLIYLESFNSPAMVLHIGPHEVVMPLEWRLAIGDRESSNDLEILPLTSLNDRGFDAFVFNPLSSSLTEFLPIKVVNFYNDMKWHHPRIRNGQLLTIPIEDGPNPRCAYFVKDISRQSETIDYSLLL